jgi:hypothetical protein
MQIPAFLLRKLYIKGSLKNVGDGFDLKIKNTLSPGTAIGMSPIKVDGVDYPLADTTISSEAAKIKASEITESKGFPIKVGVEMTIHCKGKPLTKAEHKIDIAIKTKEAGSLAFDVKDTAV